MVMKKEEGDKKKGEAGYDEENKEEGVRCGFWLNHCWWFLVCGGGRFVVWWLVVKRLVVGVLCKAVCDGCRVAVVMVAVASLTRAAAERCGGLV